MNTDDEHEYEQYYDFSITYEGHPDVQRPPLITTKKDEPAEDVKEDEWEDVDVEDGEGSGDESGAKSSQAYSIITDEKKGTSEGFSLADGSST